MLIQVNYRERFIPAARNWSPGQQYIVQQLLYSASRAWSLVDAAEFWRNVLSAL